MSSRFERTASEVLHEGRILTLREDTFRHDDGEEVTREFVLHPGAVAVVALDDRDRVVLVRQYRHPVREHLWELPAGLRDADGEPPAETARRELAEEALLAAGRWSLLADIYNSPGFCDERVLVYLAEDLRETPRPEGFVVEHEELDMTLERVPLDEAVRWVADGRIRNGSSVVGVLAAAAARAGSYPPRPVP